MQFNIISAIVLAQLAFAQEAATDVEVKVPANSTGNSTAGVNATALNSTTAAGNSTKAPAANTTASAKNDTGKAGVNATGAKAAGAKPGASPMEAGAHSPIYFSTAAFYTTLAVAFASL